MKPLSDSTSDLIAEGRRAYIDPQSLVRRFADALEDAEAERDRLLQEIDTRMGNAMNRESELERQCAEALEKAEAERDAGLETERASNAAARKLLAEARVERDRLRDIIERAKEWRDESYEGEFGKYDDYAQGYKMALRELRRILSEADTAPREDSHPEAHCQACGRDNPVWNAESEDWNLANGSPNGILCPRCFIARFEQVTGTRPIWEVRRWLPVEGGSHE